jgi:tetraacyldisaccharide 4'-kinase
MRYRNQRYDSGRARVARVEAPVISVGNLTLGGTGKTPMVEWLARWFGERGIRVTLVSRGYGAKAGAANDEARELEQKLPGVPHVLNPNRALGAREAIDQHGAQLIILDDGFQHRRLARDLDIVLIDALEPFGYDRVFPRGTLREPVEGLARAQVVGLSRAKSLDQVQRAAIRERVLRLSPRASWLELDHAPRGWRASDGGCLPLDHLAGKRLAAFCGIGNPAGFRLSLESLGLNVVAFREFDDHHAYSSHDFAELEQMATEANADALVCTHKDLVKIGQPAVGSIALWALEIGLEVLHGREALESQLTVLAQRVLAT